MSGPEAKGSGPLADVRVLELGSTVAGPFCARLLADFGAEIIKVEPPEGDAVRSMGNHKDGVSLYAASILRNKRLVAIDIKKPDGLELVRDLALRSDVLIENFRPGTLERLGLGYDVLAAKNPGLVLVRISGFGQTGPYSERPGYGVVAEAVAGIRHLTGDPDRPPARVAVAMTDMIAALYGAYAAMIAIHNRARTGKGQIIDLSLQEAAFSFMEPHIPAHQQLGLVPTRMGSGLPNTAPNNLYPTKDGSYVHIAAFGEAVFKRFADAIGMPELVTDERFKELKLRARNKDALNDIVTGWTRQRAAADVEAILLAVGVPASRIFTMADIFANPHYAARDMLPQLPHPTLGALALAGIVPKLSETPGELRWPGGEIGEHSREVLAQVLGLTSARIDELEAKKAVFAVKPSAGR
ncbi:MAG: CoA transferase [Rhodospirillales bacterium]|nr:CoA transferase [Rhodospirillales bacterium]